MDYITLGKTVSHALRHEPDAYGIVLDRDGWVSIHELLASLRVKMKNPSLSTEDLVQMIERSDKKRHEIQDGKIRALYGHSVSQKISKKPCQPPSVLYHGTSEAFVRDILKEGIRSMKRQYVHLAERIEDAEKVARRRKDKAIRLLEVDADRAFTEGITFYKEEGGIWLADYIPSKYIKH